MVGGEHSGDGWAVGVRRLLSGLTGQTCSQISFEFKIRLQKVDCGVGTGKRISEERRRL